MRLTAITFILSTTLLFATSVHALPGNAGDENDKPIAEKSFLTHIDQVRQSVTHKASELVGNAIGLIGTAYRRGGNSVETGFDCSGFVRAVYEQSIGLILPRRAEQQAAATQNIEKKDLQPGDLVFFNTMRRAFSHVGIYVGDGNFIHSPKPGASVRIESMSVSYWKGRFNGARRVKAADGSNANTSIAAEALAQQPLAAQQLQTQASSTMYVPMQSLQQEPFSTR